jgi:hypothetical protein
MKSGFTAKAIALLFGTVLVLYVVVFFAIERARHHKGPWEVDFQTYADGSPVLIVSQPKLGLSDMKIVAHGETPSNAVGRVSFDQVKRPVPFGKVIYEDLTFLPGVVTFDLFGHEIELLPRALIADKKLVAWKSGATIDLWPTNKPAEPPHPPKARSR